MKGLLELLWALFFFWALIDIIGTHRDFGWKILWIIVCLIFPVGGVLIYYFLGRGQR